VALTHLEDQPLVVIYQVHLLAVAVVGPTGMDYHLFWEVREEVVVVLVVRALLARVVVLEVRVVPLPQVQELEAVLPVVPDYLLVELVLEVTLPVLVSVPAEVPAYNLFVNVQRVVVVMYVVC
jgi:hypothetical protein